MSDMAEARVISLADRLKNRRTELGLSQAQAARELDVARTAYRLWEMEAAKPQPDRWRLISRWLGVSVTTMLLADELEEEARPDSISAAFDRVGREWEEELGDPYAFFVRARDLIQEGAENAFLNTEHAEELLAVLGRVEEERLGVDTELWEPARLHKRLRPTTGASKEARDAVAFVAGDIPADKLHEAQLLTSELVTNSVTHGSSPHATISLEIAVDRDRIRIEVTDRNPGSPQLTKPSETGGYGLALVDQIASRWDISREPGGNLTWFEVDLPSPGAKPERN
jgi:anti-sigma regulatory factor (Ser/Thr protein kinase)/transcriptional regulator with XRE-family HTH domain